MPEHEHKFQKEGDTWACFGWGDACGVRAPACFTPKPEATTPLGKSQLAADMFIAEHLVIMRVP